MSIDLGWTTHKCRVSTQGFAHALTSSLTLIIAAAGPLAAAIAYISLQQPPSSEDAAPSIDFIYHANQLTVRLFA